MRDGDFSTSEDDGFYLVIYYWSEPTDQVWSFLLAKQRSPRAPANDVPDLADKYAPVAVVPYNFADGVDAANYWSDIRQAD